MNNKEIPYSLPLINKNVISEVNNVLNETGWLTSGPKVLEFESEILKMTDSKSVVCVNSWTSGAMLALRWFGVKAGDEVIIPAYTYSATALCVLNLGAKPIMVDVNDDFTINIHEIYSAINEKTKAIIPVDIGGWPCDYDQINKLVQSDEIQKKFKPNSFNQSRLNRILVLSDAAHSIGAIYNNKYAGSLTDITVFSFHSVKNITTGEGGAICLNLPQQFDCEKEYINFKALSLNGQNKSAFAKNQLGGWRYDIVDQGLKVNMPDICAAIGLAQIREYRQKLLPERKSIFDRYNDFFSMKNWAIVPETKNSFSESSYHLYMLRINGISEIQRDKMISHINNKNIGVNVHYIPMTSLSLFKKLGYDFELYPNTYMLYQNEITLPVYNGLNKQQIDIVCEVVEEAYLNLNTK